MGLSYIGLCIVFYISLCASFLLDATTPAKQDGGFMLTDTHYYILLGALSEERHSRQQLEDQQRQLIQIVNQLQQALNETEDKVKQLENSNSLSVGTGHVNNETNSCSCSECNLLKKEYSVMEYKQILLEHNVTAMEIDMSSMFDDIQNKSCKTCISQNDRLQKELNDTRAKVLTLLHKEDNHTADVIALYNKTRNVEQKTDSLNIHLEDKLEALVESMNHSLANVAQDVSNVEYKLRTEIDNIAEFYNRSTQSLLDAIHKLETLTNNIVLKQTIEEHILAISNKHVSLSACAVGGNYHDGRVITFSNIKGQGISTDNMHLFEQTGRWSAETSGLYLFTAHITTSSTKIQYQLMKNIEVITTVVESNNAKDNDYHTGSASGALELSINDTLWVKAYADIHIVHSSNKYSCINIVKLK